VHYVLQDALLGFWFRFVYPNLSYLQHRGPARTFTDRLRPALPAYWGWAFERLCRDALPHLYAREGVEADFLVGEYWSPKVQIDVVGLRDDGWTDLGECKWGTVRSLPALRREIEAKVPAFPNARNATIGRCFFLRRRPKRLPQGGPTERWYTLEDLYAD
jgi:AAA+ ATPase superfamily predicted ATPase